MNKYALVNKPLAIATLAAGLLAGCSSGGSVGTSSVVIPPAPPGATTTSFVISTNGGGGETIASGGARPTFVSPSATSISYAVDAGTTNTQNLTATSTNCAASNGGVRCTVPLAGVAIGTHALALTAWDGPSGTGDKLGANTNIAFTVVANQANVVNGIIGGIATGVSLVPIGPGATGNMTLGFTLDLGAKPITFAANPLDAAGNVIVGPGAPVVTSSSGIPSVLTTSAGASPNSLVVTPADPNYAGPLARDLGSTALRVTVTSPAGTGANPLNVDVHLFGVTPYVYVVNANGQVQALDDSGVALPHPNATDYINTNGGVTQIAYDPATASLLAIQNTDVWTYNYVGQNYVNELGQNAAVLGTAFAWNPATGAAYGWDTVGRTMVRLDAGVTPTTITPIGAVYAPGPDNAWIAYALHPANPLYGDAGLFYAANTSAVHTVLFDGTSTSVLGSLSVGTIDGLAYDPISANLWVSGNAGLAYYQQAASNIAATPVADTNGPTGVAVDPLNDFAYVADATGHVQVFDQHGVPQFGFATAAGTHPVQILIAP